MPVNIVNRPCQLQNRDISKRLSLVTVVSEEKFPIDVSPQHHRKTTSASYWPLQFSTKAKLAITTKSVNQMAAKRLPDVQQARIGRFQFGPWHLTVGESHILQSDGKDRERFQSELKLPDTPEMVFAENVLRLKHKDGFGIEFNALDALKLVDPHQDFFKVAATKAWVAAREDCEHIKDVIKPFDWTFSTDYKGTLLSEGDMKLEVSETTEQLDLEKLKRHDKMHFYADIPLFEDELADHGTAILSVKMRVMPTLFLILLRFHMRVDDVVVRVRDTRLYHEMGKNYILREYTAKEQSLQNSAIPLNILTDVNQIAQRLPVVEHKLEKLSFPEGVAADEADFTMKETTEKTEES